MNKILEKIKPNWTPFERRPTWGWLSVNDVAALLNISPQSVHNHIGRGQLPRPDKKPNARGNKAWFRLSKIKAFLENRSEDEIHWEWIHEHLKDDKFKTIGQAQFLVKHCYDLLDVEQA